MHQNWSRQQEKRAPILKTVNQSSVVYTTSETSKSNALIAINGIIADTVMMLRQIYPFHIS